MAIRHLGHGRFFERNPAMALKAAASAPVVKWGRGHEKSAQPVELAAVLPGFSVDELWRSCRATGERNRDED